MQTVIWAFGSVLVSILIFFLPLGFTLKGKLFIVFASMLLSLGGLGAVHSFSLLSTVLVMVVLSFFIAQIMNRRVGGLFVIEGKSIEEEQPEKKVIENYIVETKMETAKNEEYVSIPVLEVEKPKIINALNDSDNQLKQTSELLETVSDPEWDSEIGGEEISIFLETDKELILEIQEENMEPSEDYLSDIESLIAEEFEENLQDEISDVGLEEKDTVLSSEFDDLEDVSLEILFGTKEAAASLDDDALETINEKLLQK